MKKPFSLDFNKIENRICKRIASDPFLVSISSDCISLDQKRKKSNCYGFILDSNHISAVAPFISIIKVVIKIENAEESNCKGACNPEEINYLSKFREQKGI